MKRTAPKNLCACEIQSHITVVEVEEHLNSEGALPLTHIRDELNEQDIFSIVRELKGNFTINLRTILQQSKIPFRIRPCPYGYTHCCGACIQQCEARCVPDIQHRIWLATSSLVASGQPVSEWNYLMQTLYHALQPPVSYTQAVTAVMSLVSSRLNPDLKARVLDYVGKGGFYEKHPHKLYYGPDRTHRNPATNRIEFKFYPSSGLCPFYVPLLAPSKSSYPPDLPED